MNRRERSRKLWLLHVGGEVFDALPFLTRAAAIREFRELSFSLSRLGRGCPSVAELHEATPGLRVERSFKLEFTGRGVRVS